MGLFRLLGRLGGLQSLRQYGDLTPEFTIWKKEIIELRRQSARHGNNPPRWSDTKFAIQYLKERKESPFADDITVERDGKRTDSMVEAWKFLKANGIFSLAKIQ